MFRGGLKSDDVAPFFAHRGCDFLFVLVAEGLRHSSNPHLLSVLAWFEPDRAFRRRIAQANTWGSGPETMNLLFEGTCRMYRNSGGFLYPL